MFHSTAPGSQLHKLFALLFWVFGICQEEGRKKRHKNDVAISLEEWNSTPESLLWLFLFIPLGWKWKMTAKITRVTDQIIALETSPVIFSANEMSVFMWVCGLLISCLKKNLWWVVCVCTETPYESHAWFHTHF